MTQDDKKITACVITFCVLVSTRDSRFVNIERTVATWNGDADRAELRLVQRTVEDLCR